MSTIEKLGIIPANSCCPFHKECDPRITCPVNGRVKNRKFYCHTANGIAISRARKKKNDGAPKAGDPS